MVQLFKCSAPRTPLVRETILLIDGITKQLISLPHLIVSTASAWCVSLQLLATRRRTGKHCSAVHASAVIPCRRTSIAEISLLSDTSRAASSTNWRPVNFWATDCGFIGSLAAYCAAPELCDILIQIYVHETQVQSLLPRSRQPKAALRSSLSPYLHSVLTLEHATMRKCI